MQRRGSASNESEISRAEKVRWVGCSGGRVSSPARPRGLRFRWQWPEEGRWAEGTVERAEGVLFSCFMIFYCFPFLFLTFCLFSGRKICRFVCNCLFLFCIPSFLSVYLLTVSFLSFSASFLFSPACTYISPISLNFISISPLVSFTRSSRWFLSTSSLVSIASTLSVSIPRLTVTSSQLLLLILSPSHLSHFRPFPPLPVSLPPTPSSRPLVGYPLSPGGGSPIPRHVGDPAGVSGPPPSPPKMDLPCTRPPPPPRPSPPHRSLSLIFSPCLLWRGV